MVAHDHDIAITCDGIIIEVINDNDESLLYGPAICAKVIDLSSATIT